MASSFFFLQAVPNEFTEGVIKKLTKYANAHRVQVYVLNRPLGDDKYSYDFDEGLIVLIPKHKVLILNCSNDDNCFEDYHEDFLEDLSSISDKYNYKEVIGRSRKWKKELVHVSSKRVNEDNIEDILSRNYLVADNLQRNSELLISLITGSINDISRIKESIPDNILDKIKQKILLFDGDQTRFIYQESEKSKITIQGLSGTGKTELLLHKLKDIYINKANSKVILTCHNRILAENLRKRIPEFFNFMKVEQQIEWNERLWCIHAWGSESNPHSGTYRYICFKYGLTYHTYSYSMPFDKACRIALEQLKNVDIKEKGYAFDNVLMDESQDFPIEFINLCELVSKDSIYVAGDIFQSIFDENIVSSIKPDFLLSKCYRTDPKTLMFAHALGMGLFEKPKLRWLSDKEWVACGYIPEKLKNGTQYLLKREPLRRFEDLHVEDVNSTLIRRTSLASKENRPENQVIDIISKIMSENRTVTPDDIGIVFLGNQKKGFALGDVIEYKIRDKFNWITNFAYRTKQKQPNTVFYSNKYNVKGLEFPFVICITDFISNALHERNALYMLLTRSFIQSYLLIPIGNQENKIKELEIGLDYINKNGFMKLDNPSLEELHEMNTTIEHSGSNVSLHEMIHQIFDELDVLPLARDPILKLINTSENKEWDYEELEKSIQKFVEVLAIPKC